MNLLRKLAQCFERSTQGRSSTGWIKVVNLNVNRVSMLISMTEASKFSSIWMTEWLFDYISREFWSPHTDIAFLWDVQTSKCFPNDGILAQQRTALSQWRGLLAVNQNISKTLYDKHKHSHRWTVKWKMLKKRVCYMNWNWSRIIAQHTIKCRK